MTYLDIKEELSITNTTLVAVSKTKPIDLIMELYQAGQRVFGENKVQELLEKKAQMPNDIEWHLIGHLQTNKVKSIIPHTKLIHGVDSLKLLTEINKEAQKGNLVVNVLLQIYIATEESKFGLNHQELKEIIELYNNDSFQNVKILGLMGMASFTDNENQVKKEFSSLKSIFNQTKIIIKDPDLFNKLSMGMSGDYKIAIECGANMVRIGSLLFGKR
jgi:PLP dependent protein